MLQSSQTPSSPIAAAVPAWRPDLGDGRYRNPVLFADYSDPDAIRVGDDYWLTASSFNHVPGLPILHSRDLVNWTLVNHALPRLSPEAHFSAPRHGCGVWAPAIRYHEGRYVILYPDPDFGLYAVEAADPRGAWSAPRLLRAGRGLIDPCPFWDDDGTGYLIHAWARSRSGINNRLTLHRLRPGSLEPEGDGLVVIDADSLPGWKTLEGPKLYKRDGWYFIFAPAGGVRNGYQAVFRSRRIEGPYEVRIVLAQGSTAVNGPHQGAWVDTTGGDHWFLHFQEMDGYGRVVHLQPMEWGTDGWPRMGLPRAEANAPGEPVAEHRKPVALPGPPSEPATSDDFEGGVPGLQWQWQANPASNWIRPAAGRRGLTLTCVPLKASHTLHDAPNLLLQKLPGPTFEVTVGLDFHPVSEGDSAGLLVFGRTYAWIGLRLQDRRVVLAVRSNPGAANDAAEATVGTIGPVNGPVLLRLTVSSGARCQFWHGREGMAFEPLGPAFPATSGSWTGAKVGVFAISAPGSSEGGLAEFREFRVGGIQSLTPS